MATPTGIARRGPCHDARVGDGAMFCAVTTPFCRRLMLKLYSRPLFSPLHFEGATRAGHEAMNRDEMAAIHACRHYADAASMATSSARDTPA